MLTRYDARQIILPFRIKPVTLNRHSNSELSGLNPKQMQGNTFITIKANALPGRSKPRRFFNVERVHMVRETTSDVNHDALQELHWDLSDGNAAVVVS